MRLVLYNFVTVNKSESPKKHITRFSDIPFLISFSFTFSFEELLPYIIISIKWAAIRGVCVFSEVLYLY